MIDNLYFLIYRHIKNYHIRHNLMGMAAFTKSAVKHWKRGNWQNVLEQNDGIWMCFRQLLSAEEDYNMASKHCMSSFEREDYRLLCEKIKPLVEKIKSERALADFMRNSSYFINKQNKRNGK